MASITIKGKEYPLRFDMYAMEQVEEEFGGIRAMFDSLTGNGNLSVAKTLRIMFKILANSARNELDLPENVTGEEIRHCNVQKVSAAISAAVNEGMKSETTGGNEADDEVHDEYLDEIESKN